MTDRSFDRIADAYLAAGPVVLPDRVLETAFEEVHRTRQRRVLWRAPWRHLPMNTFTKLAAAAAVVVAVGFLGLNLLGSGGSGIGGPPAASPTPSPTAAPSPTATAAPTPTPIVGPTAPALTGQFTSDRNGFSISYPATWSTRPATTPWMSGFVDFMNPSGDVLYESSNPGNLWLAVASQPLGDRTPAEWQADVWQYVVADDPSTAGCAAAAKPVTIDGAAGVIGSRALGCPVALVTDGGRGYYVYQYTSGDDPTMEAVYDDAWFASVLTTMTLHPEDAVDSVASATPS